MAGAQFTGQSVDDGKVSIGATIPEKLAKLIKQKADEEGILFQDKAGYYLLLGIEAERKPK